MTIEELTAALAEADRRAGEAERKLAAYVDQANKRANWLWQAKRDWGVHDNTSFDEVWHKALYMKMRLEKIIPIFEESRDAITVISETQRKLHNLAPDLDKRMDAAGICSYEEFKKEKGWLR